MSHMPALECCKQLTFKNVLRFYTQEPTPSGDFLFFTNRLVFTMSSVDHFSTAMMSGARILQAICYLFPSRII